METKVNIIDPKFVDENGLGELVKIAPPFKLQKFIFFRVLRRIAFRIGLGHIFLNKKDILKMQGTIIVFDATVTQMFLEWLAKHKTDCRLIFWYWNPVKTTIAPNHIPKVFEVWSYSKKDCEKYGFKWNSTFAPLSLANYSKKEKKQYDIVFIGRNKGRVDKIKNLSNKIREFGLTTKIVITRDKFIDFKNLTKPYAFNYLKYLSIENKSEAIIDFCNLNDAGMTLRSIESLYLNKKLIFNYSEVFSSLIPSDRYFFFDNIEDIDFEELVSFIKKKVDDPPRKVLDYYSFESWLKRFDIK